MEQTLVIIKPDALQRNLVGDIISRFEKKGLKLIGMKMMRLDDMLLREHYAHVVGESFFEELSQFMSSTPVIALVLQGPKCVDLVRMVSGITPTDMGSIRGDFSLSVQRNVIHSSDTPANAKKEIARFFSNEELFDYDKNEWTHALSDTER
jgi:nucleoside-diphosphate kinase